MPMPGAVFHVAPPVNRPGQMAPFAARNLSMSVPPVQLMSPSMLPVWNAVKLFVVTTKRVNVPVRIGGGSFSNVAGTSAFGGNGSNTASGVGSAYTVIVPPVVDVVEIVVGGGPRRACPHGTG